MKRAAPTRKRSLWLHTCTQPRSVIAGRYQHFVCEVKVVAIRHIPPISSDRSDGGLTTYRIVLPYHMRDKIPMAVLKQALAYEFDSHDCNHEHDCCGCPCNSAMTHWMRKVRRGVYDLPVSLGFNY
jgi:hypothetical protein